MHRQDPVTQQQGKEVAARQLLSLLGIGAAAGVGTRSLMGLRDMFQSRQLPVSASANLPRTISIFGKPQHPNVSLEEDPAMQKLGAAPAAPAPVAPPASPQSQGFDFIKTLAKRLPDSFTSNPIANEWGIPAGMTALGGGAYGGYKLIDWLLNKERDMSGTRDLDSAKDDYQQALAEQYRSAMMSKAAGDDLGINALAELHAAQPVDTGLVKQAFTMSAIGHMFPAVDEMYASMPGVGYDRWEGLKGGANAAALAAMLGTGKLTYDWAKGQNKQVLLQKALKRRQMMRQQLSPPPIVAMTEDQNAA